MTQYRVHSGNRVYEFDGELIGSSTSQRPDSLRWVEFDLYTTVGGSFVLSRVGKSDVFHAMECSVVEKNRLKFDPEAVLMDYHVPCERCLPFQDEYDMPVVLEKPRTFVFITEDAKTLVDSLYMKEKDTGNLYMTKVSEKLLESAAKNDKRIENAFRVQHIA